jgi:hypothetical protein
MKSCRCAEKDPVDDYQCYLPWWHDEQFHNSGVRYWTDRRNEELKKEKTRN